MAEDIKTGNDTIVQKVLAQGKQVERAAVAPDGTVTVLQSEALLQSVDVADVDLLLGFSNGTYVIIPNGALDAISDTPHKVIFNDVWDNLNALFKLVGISNPAKAGSLRVVSENIDAAKPLPDEFSTPSDELALELPPAPAPMVKVSIGTSLLNKGPGLGGSGEGEGEVPATITPLVTPQPPVYRVGIKQQQSVEDILNGLGLGEQPNFTQTLYTSPEFKITPSGRADIPLGAYDASLSSEQLALRSSPEGQSTRELLYGTSGNDTINHNTTFSTGVDQWSKTMHLTFNNFSEVSAIQIVVSATKLALIPGFDIQGPGVTRTSPTSNTWNVTPSSDIFSYGQDIQIVYTVTNSSNSVVAPVDFGADLTVTGKTGPLDFEITNNLVFTWRDATTEAEFTVPSDSGDLMMVLPRAGVGYEIFAGDGDDTVYAGAGRDLIHGGTGDDTLYGGTGDDTLDGGTGADHLDGGTENSDGGDTATYTNATTGVTAVLDNYVATLLPNTGEATGDTYEGIEHLTGSVYADILVGDAGSNTLTGSQGNDKLVGLGRDDILDGGEGIDTASYEYATSAVTVSLTSNTGTQGEADGDSLISIENLIGGSGNDTFTGAAGLQANAFDGGAGTGDTVSYAPSTAGVVAALDQSLLLAPVTQTNDAAGDTFTNIENLTGTAYDDMLIGNNVANLLSGGTGNDILEGLGGADNISGGAGTDTLSYANSALGVVSSLTTVFGTGPAVTQTNDALGDTYNSIENMIGSAQADTLIGDSSNNVINGGAGDDILEGMGGADQLLGGAGTDTASYAHGSYVHASLTSLSGFVNVGDAADDTYDSIENITGSGLDDILIGNNTANTLTGGDGNDILEGMGGADLLDGGSGTNTVSYGHSAAGVTASLLLATQNNGTGDDADGDTYSNISNLTGSAYDDTLTGDANANTLTGGDGNDTLSGQGGADTIFGDGGNDTLTDDLNGAARLYGGEGDDQIVLTSYDNLTGMQDFIDGGDGSDTLVWAGSGSRLDFNMWNGTFSNSTFTNIENITISGTNSSYIYVNNYDNVITGGNTLNDYVDYRYATGSVYINLQTGVVTGGSGNDTLSGIEHIHGGSQWDDILIGNAADNTIRGYYGNDIIDGGTGIDTWYLDWSGASVTASLLSAAQNSVMGIVMTGDAAGDTVTNMENIYASYADSLYGNVVNNNLYGRGLIEGFAGADTIRGTGSLATASYANAGNSYLASQGITTAAGVGVTATLTTSFSVGPAVVNSGDAANDTYSNINHLTGSAFSDTLIGNSSANTLTGGDGDDTLEGLGGSDTFLGGVGNDTVSFVHSTAGVLLDLQNRGIYTATNDAAGDTYSGIENVIGSNFNDTIYGTSTDNILTGGLGDDLLNGEAGFDTASYAGASGSVSINLTANTVTGAAGNDTLISIEQVIGTGNGDTIVGSAGDDVIDGGAGADTIDGGAGSDTISFASAGGGKNVVLGGANTDGDSYTSIENIIGSAYGDSLGGDGGDNRIEGGSGDDTLDGGGGNDTASYAGAAAAVTVSLAIAGAQNTAGAGTDTLTSFENLLGSAYNDILTGDANANILDGGSGDDLLIGGAGADTLIGGQGTDTVSFAAATAGVAITINGSGTNADGATVTLTGIENLSGSSHDDTLIGDSGANLIIGGSGNDTLNGMGGSDTINYADAASAITLSLASVAAQNTGGAGIDTISNFENIIGSAFADTLSGDGGDNNIEGGAGADILSGGLGADTASYAHSNAAVTVDLFAGTGSGGHAQGDTLTGFEHLVGSNFNDTLIGGGSANTLDGGAGDDLLIGGAGNDTLLGGTGNNTVSYGNALSAVNASLATGTGTAGDATGDLFSNIQNLTGSDWNDTLIGDNNNNILVGGLGNDSLTGNDGNDTLDLRNGRDSANGGNGDDIFLIDITTEANLPTYAEGSGNTSTAYGGGDTVDLYGLASGTYSLSSLFTYGGIYSTNIIRGMEILDIRGDGSSTALTTTALDVQSFVDGGTGSQIWIMADSGDTVNLSLTAGETATFSTAGSGATDYTIYNSSGTQIAQIHWQVA